MNLRQISTICVALSALAFASIPAQAKISSGDMVPNITVTDTSGKTHNLADYKGKTVVLEWTNHLCPYVKKHYNTDFANGGNMQNLQKAATKDGVVWISVISSAPGKQGYVSGPEANTLSAERGAVPSAVILDPAGTVGRIFSAKTTPHMYVINADQTLVYQGAIDDNRGASPTTIDGATNYVTATLSALETGSAVATTETTPYGCQVKY